MALKNKKKMSIIIISIIFIIATIMFYKVIGSINIERKANDFLKIKGYMASDILNIKVKHSFFHGFLSDNEWSILARFTSEPDVIYSFAYKNKEIIFSGIYDSTKEKDELKELEDKFYNGELRNN